MGLAEKMFSRIAKTCPAVSDCGRESNQKYIASLFEQDWEVFVIKRNSETDSFDWFTLCCEAENVTKNDKRNTFSAARR